MKSFYDGLPLKIDPDSNPSRLYEDLGYKDFWSNPSRIKLDKLERIIIRDFLPDSGRRIIDIGCGFGRLANCYLDRFDEVVMVDGSMSLLRQAKDMTGGRAVYVAADANHLPFHASSFDCALMVRVFHHMHDSKAILRELHRILTAKGILCFNYCNKLSARQLFKWLFRMSRKALLALEPTGVGTEFITHHPKYISSLLSETGFSCVKYLGTGIIDKLADKVGRFHYLIPSGRFIAPLFGAIKLAPWIFCRAIANSESVRIFGECVEHALICPLCRSDVKQTSQEYVCVSCGQSYPIDDGIADFRLNF